MSYDTLVEMSHPPSPPPTTKTELEYIQDVTPDRARSIDQPQAQPLSPTLRSRLQLQSQAGNQKQEDDTAAAAKKKPKLAHKSEQQVEVGGFATWQAQYKFNTGMERLNTLIDRSSRGTPDTSQHLRALRDRLANPNLSLDHREDGDVDVEKTRVWKFRFLDLIIEMVLDGGGMARMEVANVLLYAEAVMRGMREEMDVKGKGKAVEGG
jgi:hypothetical protein